MANTKNTVSLVLDNQLLEDELKKFKQTLLGASEEINKIASQRARNFKNTPQGKDFAKTPVGAMGSLAGSDAQSRQVIVNNYNVIQKQLADLSAKGATAKHPLMQKLFGNYEKDFKKLDNDVSSDLKDLVSRSGQAAAQIEGKVGKAGLVGRLLYGRAGGAGGAAVGTGGALGGTAAGAVAGLVPGGSGVMRGLGMAGAVGLPLAAGAAVGLGALMLGHAGFQRGKQIGLAQYGAAQSAGFDVMQRFNKSRGKFLGRAGAYMTGEESAEFLSMTGQAGIDITEGKSRRQRVTRFRERAEYMPRAGEGTVLIGRQRMHREDRMESVEKPEFDLSRRLAALHVNYGARGTSAALSMVGALEQKNTRFTMPEFGGVSGGIANAQHANVIGVAMGLGMVQGLKKERKLELLSGLTQLIRSGPLGYGANPMGMLQNMATIGTIPGLKGGQGAQALGILSGLAQGQGGGFASAVAYRAAGLGKGTDYWQARRNVQEAGTFNRPESIGKWFEAAREMAPYNKARYAMISKASGGRLTDSMAEQLDEAFKKGSGSKEYKQALEKAHKESMTQEEKMMKEVTGIGASVKIAEQAQSALLEKVSNMITPTLLKIQMTMIKFAAWAVDVIGGMAEGLAFAPVIGWKEDASKQAAREMRASGDPKWSGAVADYLEKGTAGFGVIAGVAEGMTKRDIYHKWQAQKGRGFAEAIPALQEGYDTYMRGVAGDKKAKEQKSKDDDKKAGEKAANPAKTTVTVKIVDESGVTPKKVEAAKVDREADEAAAEVNIE